MDICWTYSICWSWIIWRYHWKFIHMVSFVENEFRHSNVLLIFMMICFDWLYRANFYCSSFFVLIISFFVAENLVKVIWRANIKWCRFRKANKTLGNNPVKEVLVVTLITAFVSYFNPYTRRSSSSLIRQVDIAFFSLNFSDALWILFSDVCSCNDGLYVSAWLKMKNKIKSS